MDIFYYVWIINSLLLLSYLFILIGRGEFVFFNLNTLVSQVGVLLLSILILTPISLLITLLLILMLLIKFSFDFKSNFKKWFKKNIASYVPEHLEDYF